MLRSLIRHRARLARSAPGRCRVHPDWLAYDHGLCGACLEQFPTKALVLVGFTTEEIDNIRLAMRLDVSLDTEDAR